MATVHTTNTIRFFYQEISFPFKHRTLIKQYLTELFTLEQKSLAELTYIFCNDPFLLEINQQYLFHDFYTDIITFDLSASAAITGEIYISIDRVRENASTYKHSFSQELLRVIFHGALHLCGYKDKTPAQTTSMRNREDFHLSRYKELLQRST